MTNSTVNRVYTMALNLLMAGKLAKEKSKPSAGEAAAEKKGEGLRQVNQTQRLWSAVAGRSFP